MDSNIYRTLFDGWNSPIRLPKSQTPPGGTSGKSGGDAGSVNGLISSSANPMAIPVTNSVQRASGGVGDLGAVIFSYTVPKNRRATLENAIAKIVRSAAATALGTAQAFMFVQRNGQTLPAGAIYGPVNNKVGGAIITAARLTDNAVGANTKDSMTGSVVELFEGDILTGLISDDSTGPAGSAIFNIDGVLIEYDQSIKGMLGI